MSTKLTRHQRAGKTAIEKVLHGVSVPVSLWALSCVADEAARKVGRKSDLYESLGDYLQLVPDGWKPQWLKSRCGSGDSVLMVVPPGWVPGKSESNSLLLGSGALVPTSCFDRIYQI